MTLLWTKSKLPTGALISWGLNEPVSHFAILFGDSIVLHSNFTGVHCESFSDFSKLCKIVYMKKFNLTFSEEASLFLSIMKNYLGKKYDWKFFFSLCFYAFRYRVLGIAFPVKIKWSSRHRYLCTEMAKTLETYIGKIEVGYGSPYQLAVQLDVT